MHHRRIFAAGNSYARGESIGRRWRNRIITILKSNENAALFKDAMTLHDWLPHARGLLPFIQKYAPNTMEEMKRVGRKKGQPLIGLLKGVYYHNETLF